MNRIRRISEEILSTYREQFSTDFKENKKVLDQVAVVRFKGLKNEIAGYITSQLRRELEAQKEKESQTDVQTEPRRETEKMEEQLVS